MDGTNFSSAESRPSNIKTHTRLKDYNLEKIFKRPKHTQSAQQNQGTFSAQESNNILVVVQQTSSQGVNSKYKIDVDVKNLNVSDPGLRISILDHDPNDRDNVRRAYWLKGSCQPILKDYPQTNFSGVMRRFNSKWYKEYHTWLEYSEYKDTAFYLCCYLFKADYGDQGAGDAFVSRGFSTWKNKKVLDAHVGDHNSIHSKCLKSCQYLINQKQHIDINLSNFSDQSKIDYRVRLNASVGCVRFLLRQGLAFRGHDESADSRNQGNCIELLKFLFEHSGDINKVVLGNAPENNKLIAPSIQKEIASACGCLTTKAIVEDIGDEFFARDASTKEQMGVILCYVNKHGCIIERFLGIVHVTETTARSLMGAIESLLAKHNLSMSRLHGQGYDGASNMKGEFNGLKSLIMTENKSVYYVHCFAHQLQLTLIAVATNHDKLNSFFEYLALLTNTVGGSCKRLEILRNKQHEQTAKGRNYDWEKVKSRSNITMCWRYALGSHFGTIISLLSLFSPIVSVVQALENDSDKKKRFQASNLLDIILEFEFVFLAHLMQTVLGITNDLLQTLQRKDQDFVNTVSLVRVAKLRLQNIREVGWEPLLTETCEFCEKHQMTILLMEDIFVARRRS